MRNREEDSLISSLDRMQIYAQLEPLIRATIKYGGGADTILAKSQSLAAVQLLSLLESDKEEVRLNAAKEILNRAIGKPVERKVSLHGDIGNMNEREIESSIKQLLKTATGGDVIDAVIAKAPEVKAARVKAQKIKQAPKPVTIEVKPGE